MGELKNTTFVIVDAKGLLAAMRIVTFLRWCAGIEFCYWCEEQISEFDLQVCPWEQAWRDSYE